MMIGRIFLFAMMWIGIFSAPNAFPSDHSMSATIYGGGRPSNSSGQGDRLTDMSHAFRGGELKERKAVLDSAAQADDLVRSYQKMASDPSSLVPLELRHQLANISAGKQEVMKLVEKRNRVRDEIVGRDHQEIRQELVGIATDSLRSAREYYLKDEYEEGQIASTIADVALDLATSFTPGVSWGRDIYEAITGKNLIDGGELDTFSRSMAVVGAVTVGFGSKIGKAMKVMGKAMRGANAADTLHLSRRIIDSSTHAGEKWSRTAKTLQDQMTFNAAQKGAGNPIINNLSDPSFKGMEKWEYRVKSVEGKDSVVHYVRDPETGKLMDFKFKKHSAE